MKIFDGVELKQTPGSGIQNWLSVAMLIASSFLEADKCRQERLTGGPGGPAPSPNTLEEVMAQAGLKIPALEEALGQLMGGSDEAKQAAAMIARAPEPGKLLQQFAKQFGFSGAANAGPVVTPPPAARPAVAESPSFRPEFTREARQAARVAAADAGEPPSFRPEFTREARQAERAAATVSPAATAGPVETSRPSLVSLVEGQLAALRQRMKAHEEVIDARLKRAESELAAMRQELEQRSPPMPAVAPEEGAAGHANPDPKVATADRPAPEVAPDEVVAEEPVKVELPLDESAPAVTDEHVAQAVGLISAFAQAVEERHQQQLAHVDAVEHEVQILRSKIAVQSAANYA